MLSAIFEKNTKKNSDGAISNVICNSAKQGLIPQREYFDKDIANSDNTAGYYIIEQNDFVYNPRKSADAPYGPISSYKYVDPGIVSPLYLCFRAKSIINPRYYEWYFKSSVWHRYIYMSGDSGARHDRVSIKDDTFFAMPIHLPSENEQRRIASFLDILESRIEKQRTLVDSLKKYKRGLSDKIFSTIVITSNCKKISWKNVFLPLQNNTFSRDDLIQYGGTVRDIHYGDILVKYGATVNLSSVDVPCIKPEKDISKFSINSYLQNGDIVIADTAEDYSVGKATEIIGSNGIMALSGLHTIPCRPCIEFVPMYLGYYLNSSYFRKQIYPMVQGTKVSSISKSEIAKTEILVPSQLEQQRVASILYGLDQKIGYEENQINALVHIKSAFLQQLFI